MCFAMKIVYPVYLSDQKYDDSMYLLLVSNHYVYIKNFDRFMFNKTKKKKYYGKSCLQCFSSKKVFNGT